MILFHCAFLALKAQDEANPVRELDDHILEGEKPIFSGYGPFEPQQATGWGNTGLMDHRIIIDDNYQHALQILKDEDSGGIRLQASVLRGPLKRSV